jgi:hypothetical protein
MLRWMLRRSARGDEGVGLLLVIGTTTVVTMLMIIVTTMATRALTSSSKHVSFESAVAAAESGIDEGLARAQQTYDSLGADSYAFPSTSAACGSYTGINWKTSTAPDGTAAPGSFTVEAQGLAVERQWAKSWLQSIAAASSSCRFTGPKGDFTFFKPVGHQAIYGMGWSPTYSSPASTVKMRYLKAEYLFTPFAPSNAILTQGTLDLSSSTTVTTAPPNSPTLASVHTNGNLTNATGNPTVYGAVSQSGSGALVSDPKFMANPGGTVASSTVQGVPFISAREVWGRQHANSQTLNTTWYDLCGDGSVRIPTSTTVAPCDAAGTDDPIAPNGSATTVTAQGFRGWTHGSVNGVSTWYAGSGLKGNNYSGVYYINGGDVVDNASNAGSPVSNLTVIAAATASGCPKTGGNISWSHTDGAAPGLQGTFLLADQDLVVTANVSFGSDINNTPVSGFFIAGDQVDMETSSNGVYGAIIAADMCNPAGSLVSTDEVKNPSIYYDPNVAAPFVDIVNTTLWLEFAG